MIILKLEAPCRVLGLEKMRRSINSEKMSLMRRLYRKNKLGALV